MMEELRVEVHRITNCPYTPSLKVPKIKDGGKEGSLVPLSVLRAFYAIVK